MYGASCADDRGGSVSLGLDRFQWTHWPKRATLPTRKNALSLAPTAWSTRYSGCGRF